MLRFMNLQRLPNSSAKHLIGMFQCSYVFTGYPITQSLWSMFLLSRSKNIFSLRNVPNCLSTDFPRKNNIYINYIYIIWNILWLNVHYDCKLSDRNDVKSCRVQPLSLTPVKGNTRKYSQLSITQPLIRDKRIIRNKNEICLR